MIVRDIYVIIPAYNEQNSVNLVVQDIPGGLVKEVIVVDNNSSDKTGANALSAGATLLRENKQGYGFACLKGIDYLQNKAKEGDVVVFLDADYSDYPGEMKNVISPIINQNYDMVIGSRALGKKEKGSMTPQQVFGNWLATTLIRFFYKAKFTDLGPFRAITFGKLMELEMKDKTYGWTVEMQLKAAKRSYRFTEVPVNYKKRIGKSKVSGTLKGTVMAGYKILSSIFKYL